MTPEDIILEAKVDLSKSFAPGSGQVLFAQYALRAIPSSLPGKSEAVLSFVNALNAQPGASINPEEEANIATKLLSLFWDCRIHKNGTRINQVDVSTATKRDPGTYPQFSGVLDPSDTDKLIKAVLCLPLDLARQVTRACHAFAFALEFMPEDPTFAFFLLVVAVECLSSQDTVIPFSQLPPDKNKCERFCQYIKLYLCDQFKGQDEKNDDLFTELLKTVYYAHRSAFVHGGKEVSRAALMADQLKSSYFKHSVEQKEVRTPGLGWFARIVRGSLIGFLLSKGSSSDSIDANLLSKLAAEKGQLSVKLKKDIQAGQVLTSGDIEYR